MQEQLITFETAKLAKEKGFILSHPLYLYDENGEIINLKRSFDLARQTFILDSKTTLAPTQSLLQKWLREIHNIHIKIHSLNGDKFSFEVYFMISKNFPYKDKTVYSKVIYKSYELSLEDALQEALKLI